MVRWIALCCCLLGSRGVMAEPVEAPGTASLCPAPIGGEERWGYFIDWRPPFLRDTALGARPHGGPKCSPTEGYHHYDLPSKHYGMWFRPAAFAEDRNSHCKSRIYAPRGYGWANRLDPMQMDYHPYVVKQPCTQLGPSYYHRPPPEPCHCGLQAKGERRGALVR